MPVASPAFPRLLTWSLWGALVGCRPTTARIDSGTGELGELEWSWGDLHAHSAWSFDGCERPEQDCTHAPEGPASGFYDAAAQAGLDFAALTDHAEADEYTWAADALHAAGGSSAVWRGQQAIVWQAKEGPVLPVLGYEWTHSTALSGGAGSHRTVLLEGLEACDAWRVGGRWLDGGVEVPELGERSYTQLGERVESLPAGLWQALSEAGAQPGCQPMRWISFAHHPAYLVPQATDWSVPANAPLAETLVEIHSEHGSSECRDPVVEGCDWAINPDQLYHAPGSVQAALDHGFQLGFVGGTDGHDARPGSLRDGPSPVAQWDEEGTEPESQFGPGALTGVLAPAELTREALFDALIARRTVASSGPRPRLDAWAEGQDGTRYPPGSLVPDWNLPATLFMELRGLDRAGTLQEEDLAGLRVDRLASGGLLVDWSEGEVYQATWDPRADESWTYLRLRLSRKASAPPLYDEERVWLSPWFVDRQAGCATLGGSRPGAPVLILLPLLGLAYRTKRTRATPSQARASRPGPSHQERRGGGGSRLQTQASSSSRKGS